MSIDYHHYVGPFVRCPRPKRGEQISQRCCINPDCWKRNQRVDDCQHDFWAIRN